MQSAWKWVSNTRYYKIQLQKNLFEEWTLVKEWGGLYNRLGSFKYESFDNYEEVIESITRISKKRKSRGYHLLNR